VAAGACVVVAGAVVLGGIVPGAAVVAGAEVAGAVVVGDAGEVLHAVTIVTNSTNRIFRMQTVFLILSPPQFSVIMETDITLLLVGQIIIIWYINHI
jgi:hypothetical protein